MKRMTVQLLICIFAGNLVLMAQSEPGVSTGKKIGTVVRSAIETALPAVGPLLDLIWEKRPSGKNKLKKDQLEEALTNARKEMQDAFTEKAQKKLAPVNETAEELRVVTRFLGDSIRAKENLIRMQVRISMNPDPIWWNTQTSDWAVAKRFLNRIGEVTDHELGKINEVWVFSSNVEPIS